MSLLLLLRSWIAPTTPPVTVTIPRGYRSVLLTPRARSAVVSAAERLARSVIMRRSAAAAPSARSAAHHFGARTA